MHPAQSAFQFAYIGANPLGDKKSHLVRQRNIRLLGFFHQYGDPGFQFRRFDSNGQTPAKKGFLPFFNAIDFARITVAGQNNLLTTFNQIIESMEKFLLRAFFACKELNIVN